MPLSLLIYSSIIKQQTDKNVSSHQTFVTESNGATGTSGDNTVNVKQSSNGSFVRLCLIAQFVHRL